MALAPAATAASTSGMHQRIGRLTRTRTSLPVPRQAGAAVATGVGEEVIRVHEARRLEELLREGPRADPKIEDCGLLSEYGVSVDACEGVCETQFSDPQAVWVTSASCDAIDSAIASILAPPEPTLPWSSIVICS